MHNRIEKNACPSTSGTMGKTRQLSGAEPQRKDLGLCVPEAMHRGVDMPGVQALEDSKT